MKIIALYSIKGGVGKTATCVNLAYLCAAGGRTTLLCDLDPQGAATYYFRIKPKSSHSGRKLLKGGKKIERAIRGTDFPGLDLLPADFSYRQLDILLDGFSHSKNRLHRLFDTFEERYEVVFLDCPPTITLVSENVFRAADAILVPLIPTTLSLLTFRKLERFFKDSGLSKSLLHPFLSMVEPRKQMHRETIRQILKEAIEPMETGIPYSAEVEKMGTRREPLVHTRPTVPAALAFSGLWREIEHRILKQAPHGP